MCIASSKEKGWKWHVEWLNQYYFLRYCYIGSIRPLVSWPTCVKIEYLR